MSFKADDIYTVILAGGRGSRMQGEDKGLMLWHNRPLIEHIIDTLQLDPDRTIISANRNMSEYQQYGYPVINDSLTDYQGPLAGVLSALQHCNTPYLMCVPCDTPSPPEQLMARLFRCMVDARANLAVCHDGQRMQPLFALLSTTLQPQLENYLAQGHRKVQTFFADNQAAICDFSDQADRFRNFNNPEDMQ